MASFIERECGPKLPLEVYDQSKRSPRFLAIVQCAPVDIAYAPHDAPLDTLSPRYEMNGRKSLTAPPCGGRNLALESDVFVWVW